MPARFLGTVAAVLALLSCTGPVPGQATAAPIQPGPLTEIGLSRLADELVTAHAIGTESIVLATNTGRIYVMPRAQPGAPPRLVAQLPGKILEVELSPDGHLLAAQAGDVLFGPLPDGPFIVRTAALGAGALAFAPDATRLAVAGSDGVTVYDTRNGALLSEHTPAEVSDAHGSDAVGFTPDGGMAAVGEVTERWRPGQRVSVSPRIDCGCRVSGAATSLDGARLVFGTTDGHVVVVDTLSGRVLMDETITAKPRALARAVAVSTDSRLAAALTSTGDGIVVDLRSADVLWRGSVPGHEPQGAHFADDDRALVIHETNNEIANGGEGFAIQSWHMQLYAS